MRLDDLLVTLRAYFDHPLVIFIAGVRHVWMDVSHKAVSKSWGGTSAQVTLGLSLFLTLVLALKLFGVY